jgi:hypothetical protein
MTTPKPKRPAKCRPKSHKPEQDDQSLAAWKCIQS